MEGAVTWTIDRYAIVGAALLVFGLVGLRRGVHREMLSMAGIGLGALTSKWIARALTPQINRLHRLIGFTLQGGLSGDDPTEAWRRIGAAPDLVQSADDVMLVSVVVFLVIVLTAYLWGQQRAPSPAGILPRALGLIAGAINGFLACYYLVPLLFTTPRAIVAVPSGDIGAALGNDQTLAFVVVSLVAIVIAFGLYSASRPGPERRQ